MGDEKGAERYDGLGLLKLHHASSRLCVPAPNLGTGADTWDGHVQDVWLTAVSATRESVSGHEVPKIYLKLATNSPKLQRVHQNDRKFRHQHPT